jgi:hypothetical protein
MQIHIPKQQNRKSQITDLRFDVRCFSNCRQNIVWNSYLKCLFFRSWDCSARAAKLSIREKKGLSRPKYFGRHFLTLQM